MKRTLVSLGFVFLPLALFIMVPARGADSWSGKVVLTAASDSVWNPGARPYFTPIHATLLPNGSVLFKGFTRPLGASAPFETGSYTGEYRYVTLFTPPASTAPTTSPPPGPDTTDARPWIDAKLKFTPTTPDGNCIRYDELFCSGHTLLNDGRVFIVGGDRFNQDVSDLLRCGDPTLNDTGLDYASIYDPTLGFTTSQPNLVGLGPNAQHKPWRWYGTATRLQSSKIMIAGGWDIVELAGSYNESVESWDGTTSTVLSCTQGVTSGVCPGSKPISPRADVTKPDTSYTFNPDYTHIFQVMQQTFDGTNNFDVLMFGQWGAPVWMNPLGTTTATMWKVRSALLRPFTNPTATPLPDWNIAQSTVLLPLRLTAREWGYSNGSVLVAGGDVWDNHEKFVDVYDVGVYPGPPTGTADSWPTSLRKDTGTRRRYPSTVLLPDGKILIVGGYDRLQTIPPAPTDPQYAQTINPRVTPWGLGTGTALMGETRAYHGTALLLPDGRVLVGGGSDNDAYHSEKGSLRYYHPAYWTLTGQPTLGSVQSNISYGTTFPITGTWTPGATIEVVLMGLGSMTHSVDMNQRYVQLQVVSNNGSTNATIAPPPATTDGARLAPAGYYMLFLVDVTDPANPKPCTGTANGAKIVKLS